MELKPSAELLRMAQARAPAAKPVVAASSTLPGDRKLILTTAPSSEKFLEIVVWLDLKLLLYYMSVY